MTLIPNFIPEWFISYVLVFHSFTGKNIIDSW